MMVDENSLSGTASDFNTIKDNIQYRNNNR